MKALLSRKVCAGFFAMALLWTVSAASAKPASLDLAKAEEEIGAHYSKAHPEVQEFVRLTANTFGENGLWLTEDALAHLSAEEREKKVLYLAALLNDGEYGRHLCKGLAEASALKDKRLVPGLLKVAGYHVEGQDYDCRAKWMAVAALARQEGDGAIPLCISLLDHGNRNTRMWASALLARKTRQNFGKDKKVWLEWWEKQSDPNNKPIRSR